MFSFSRIVSLAEQQPYPAGVLAICENDVPMRPALRRRRRLQQQSGDVFEIGKQKKALAGLRQGPKGGWMRG